MCMCVYVFMCVYLYLYVCGCTCMCRVHVRKSVFIFICVLVTCCSDLNSFVRSELGNGRFIFVLIVDPIHWRFEDWSMWWSGDPYRFVRWRSDTDLDSKLVSFHVSVCSVSFPYLSLSILFICYLYLFMWLSDIFDQYNYMYHFI